MSTPVTTPNLTKNTMTIPATYRPDPEGDDAVSIMVQVEFEVFSDKEKPGQDFTLTFSVPPQVVALPGEPTPLTLKQVACDFVSASVLSERKGLSNTLRLNLDIEPAEEGGAAQFSARLSYRSYYE